jgi:hypothetical protein
MARHILKFLAVISCAISFSSTAVAQSSPGKQVAERRDRSTVAKALLESDTARLKKARLTFAIQIVSSLADEARSYKDQSLRVRVQASAADALWDVDNDRARTLFARAWEAAQTVDEEGRRLNREERERFLSRRGGAGFIPPAPNLRAEVLRLASRHDRALAEGFLAKMERDEEESKEPKSWDPTEPSEAIAKRLNLARQVLENGEADKALLIAGPALNRVTSPGIIFLVLLREKNPATADQLFGSLLERTASDGTADATSVSLISSYVFTPSVLVTSTRSGVVVNRWTATLPPPQLAPGLRARFFSVAGQILLRPVGPPELELTSAGLAGTYFTVQRLLPLFEQNDPVVAIALQGRLNTLAEGRGELIPEQHRALMNAGFNAQEKKGGEPDDTLAQIERASSTRERDHLYAMAASVAVKKNDPKARELANKIDDPELRKSVRGFVDFLLVSKFLAKPDLEKALQLARTGELSHLQRAWSYAEIAALQKSAAREQAMESIREAATEAERISVTSSESAQAWVALARRGAEVDPARKWETVLDAIKKVNNAPGYTGDENELSVSFQSKNNVQVMQVPAPSINLVALFETLSAEDIYQAADMARSITNESARAVALIATASSAFDQKAKKNKR